MKIKKINKKQLNSFIRNLIFPIIALTIILLFWIIVSAIKNNPLVLPMPGIVLKRFFILGKEYAFWKSVGATISRSLIAFLISFIFALSVAILSGLVKNFNKIISPIVAFLRAAPTVAVILIIYAFMSTDIMTIVVGFLIAFPIMYSSFYTSISEIDEKLHLQEIIKRPVGKLSGGQRRRADVARALIHNPKILILDEPTTGLDPQTRRMLWEVISELRVKRKITVLLTTHYMEEAADADYVVIMDNGKISAEGTPIELKNKYSGDFINLYNVDEEKVKILGKKYEKTSVGYKVEVEDTKTATELILKYPEIFSDYEIRKGKMDDVFLAVTGKKLIEGEKR